MKSTIKNKQKSGTDQQHNKKEKGLKDLPKLTKIVGEKKEYTIKLNDVENTFAKFKYVLEKG